MLRPRDPEVTLSKEELEIALSQIGITDRSAASKDSQYDNRDFFIPVSLPPRNAEDDWSWIGIDPYTRRVNTRIEQPERNE